MICRQVLNPPAHVGLSPNPLSFRFVVSEWRQRIIEATSALTVERADHVRPEPFGYYRLGMHRERLLFGHVVRDSEAPRIYAAERLADALYAKNVPVPRPCGSASLGDGYHMFMREWKPGGFAFGTLTEMRVLGTQLAALHRALNELPLELFNPTPLPTMWMGLEKLASAGCLTDEAAEMLSSFLTARHDIEARVFQPSQPIHNDLHLGNVLFDDAGNSLTFLDLEEATHSFGSPILDLSWTVERFCFLGPKPKNAPEMASELLSAYTQEYGGLAQYPGSLIDSMQWRSFYALGLLSAAKHEQSGVWNSEWDKFLGIISSIKRWTNTLEKLERRYFRAY